MHKRCQLAVSELLVKVKNYPDVSTWLCVCELLCGLRSATSMFKHENSVSGLHAAGLQQLVCSSWNTVAGL